MKKMSLKELIESLPRKPGIVVGPGATRVTGQISEILSNSFKLADPKHAGGTDVTDGDYRLSIADFLENNPDKERVLRDDVCDRIRKIRPSLDIPHLAKAGWSACISLTEDLVFEGALRNHYDSVPSSKTVTIIDSLSQIPPERTIPVYKLLGNVNEREPESELVLTESQMLVRQHIWPRLLSTIPDYLRGAPILFVGTDTVIPDLRSLLGALVSMPAPQVNKLLFLADDTSLNDPTIKSLCSRFNVSLVDANLRDLCNAVANYKPNKQLSLFAPKVNAADEDLVKLIDGYAQVVSLVPRAKPEGFDARLHMQELVDGLFRPASVDWSPFLFGLDLKRTINEEIKEKLSDIFLSYSGLRSNFLIIHGEAGVGKTTLLKRVAVEMAADGAFVLWCKRAGSGSSIKHFRALENELSNFIRNNPDRNDRFLIICDDPWSLKINGADLFSGFEKFAGKVVFVFSVRNSDYLSGESQLVSSRSLPSNILEVPFELDKGELADLSEMLVRIGAVKDKEEAGREIAQIRSYRATDILCSLWYLIPETRSQLAGSLRDEYCRLGSIKDSVASVAHELTVTSKAAHQAYEFVTVTSNLGIGLPIEVLVHALGIEYSDWLDMTVDGRPLWGLLYDDEDERNGNISFWTRNEVVTKILLELVNGGVGHAGEMRVLKALVEACSVGSNVYRSFVIDVLVNSRKKLEGVLNFEQGIELFEAAKRVMPYEDRLLEHHKGIWIADKGSDIRLAYVQYERALRSSEYPGSDRAAPLEHIHTSMASAVVRMVKEGIQDRVTGYDLVRDHLRQASSPSFFSTHSAHVSANLLYEYGLQGNGAGSDALRLSSFSEALQEIERVLQIIGGAGARHEKSIEMLYELQRKILNSISEFSDLSEVALELFKTSKSQVGLEVYARKLLTEAGKSGKGSAFNDVKLYLDGCFKLISDAGVEPSIDLLVVKCDLAIRWRIQKFHIVRWIEFKDDLYKVVSSPRHIDDVIKRFYLAVAQYHLGEITEANAIFAGLRRLQINSLMPWDVRCYYISEEGQPKRFQGTFNIQHQREYVLIPDIGTTVMAKGIDAVNGSIVHPYLGFSLNGPLAVSKKPSDKSPLLM